MGTSHDEAIPFELAQRLGQHLLGDAASRSRSREKRSSLRPSSASITSRVRLSGDALEHVVPERLLWG
jgi:hypothetical protein